MEITYNRVVHVARTRYATVQGPRGRAWADLDDQTRHMFVEMSRVWLQATADAGLLTPSHVYRADSGPVQLGGPYSSLAAAQQHCEHHLAENLDLEDYAITWVPDHEGDDAVTQLRLRRPADDPATTYVAFDQRTGYAVTPFTLHTEFEPRP